jgi:putative restriction endonuclease
MLGYIAVTDRDWFEFLRLQPNLDEVNFWRPSDTRTPRQLVAGIPFMFKLRREDGDRITGFGIYARHEVLPASIAWDWFGLKNGAEDFAGMRHRIERLRGDRGSARSSHGDYPIGCLMLAAPVFFDERDWVAPPEGWPPNAVQGKAYDVGVGEGARVWEECLAAAERVGPRIAEGGIHAPPPPRYGPPTLMTPRLGQGIFRAAVTSAYERACAVTGEHSLPALEAAHIRPYGDGGAHEVANGLLFRSDIHRLFDKGYVGVTREHAFVVSRRLKDDFANGRSYYPLHGQVIRLPPRVVDRPDPRLLDWHLEKIYRG